MTEPNFSSTLLAQAAGDRRPVLEILARRRALEAVWDRLEFNFPACRHYGQRLFLARRQGDLRAYFEAHYPDMDGLRPPSNQAEWERLGCACMNFLLGTSDFPAARLYLHPANWPK